EPSYGGRSLSEWVGRLDAAAEPAATKEAEEAIRRIGTNALPYLLEWIQYERPAWVSSLNRVTGGLLKKHDISLQLKNSTRAEQSVKAFPILGPHASGAIPQLLRLMNDS